MARYLLRRLLYSAVALLGISLVVFVLIRLTGDPAAAVLGPDATPQDVARFRQEWGLDRPILVQYSVFLSHAARGDLGLSMRTFQPAMALGASDARVLRKHVLPNVAASVIVIGTQQVATMILAEAALSYLGLGVQPPTPAWGGMVADGRNYLGTAWYVSTIPGMVIFITVLDINLFGDWLRDRLDPRLRRI